MKQIYKIILLVALIFLIGFSAGYFYCSYKERFVLLKNLDYLYPIRLNDSAYKFTNPLLAYMIPPADEDPRFQDLKDKISDLINAQKQNGLKRASVLLSDLNEGRWIGVNEDDEYSPASMFKVVIMIAYLKASEQVPGLLDRKLTYTKNLDDQLKTTPLDYKTSLQIGSSYTINELINKMIIDSDNGAKCLLMDKIDASFFKDLFRILDLPPYNPNADLSFSPRQYSLFFRIIYSATFLNANSSEWALNLLSKTTFNDGLVAGVPKGTTVSHKFGMYATSKDENITDLELHDCGIIYYKTTPYLLCVV